MPSPERKAIKKQDFNAIHDNTSTELISITTDKLKLILNEYLENVDSGKSWHVPLSLFVAIVLVFCSAQFKAAFGLSADSWCAIFVLSGIGSFIWLCVSLYRKKSQLTLDQVIDHIKNKT